MYVNELAACFIPDRMKRNAKVNNLGANLSHFFSLFFVFSFFLLLFFLCWGENEGEPPDEAGGSRERRGVGSVCPDAAFGRLLQVEKNRRNKWIKVEQNETKRNGTERNLLKRNETE